MTGSRERPSTFSMARFAAISQFSGEVTAFLLLGLWIDHRMGWMPWSTVAGGVLGLCVGLYHLIRSVQSTDRARSSDRRSGNPL